MSPVPVKAEKMKKRIKSVSRKRDDDDRRYYGTKATPTGTSTLKTKATSSGTSMLKETPDLAPRELELNKLLLLLFENCGAEEMSYSLYKVDIDLKNKESYSPLLVKKFEREKFPAQGMKCAKLGSKLYFLGGSYKKSCRQVHPRNVYEFDVTTCKLKKMKATLNTGKPHPCAVFAVNGILYAIGTIIYDPYNSSTLSPFECYDPEIGKWQVLKNPPVSEDTSIFWVGSTVLEKRQKVVLMGSESPMSDHVLVKFTYDLKEEKRKEGMWSYEHIFRYEEGPLTLGFLEGDDEEYLYGIHGLGLPLKSKTGCISWSQESDLFNGGNVDGLIQMSIDDDATTPELKTQAFHQPYLYSSTMVRHLGSNYFCYITSGSNPKDRDEFGYLHSDPNSRGIMITLFKESEEEKHSFKASILNSESYTIETRPGKAQAELVECFAV